METQAVVDRLNEQDRLQDRLKCLKQAGQHSLCGTFGYGPLVSVARLPLSGMQTSML